METKLNIRLCRDLTLMGRTLLSKTLGISKLAYTASMLTVPQEVIKRVQTKLFNFLWKNKKDKVKREVLYQEMRRGGLNFPNFSITVKALRLSWIGRLLEKKQLGWCMESYSKCLFRKVWRSQLLTLVQLQYKEVRQNCIVILLRNARLL